MTYTFSSLLSCVGLISYAAASTNESALLTRISNLEKNLQEVKSQLQHPSEKPAEHKTTDFKYRFGGTVKVDAFYDINAKGAAFGLDAAALPLKGIDAAAKNRRHFNAGISASRVFAEASKSFNTIDTQAYVELDFAKDALSENATTTSVVPRIRHAYVKAAGFLLGQTWYTFQDMSAFTNTLDNLYGGSRQTMIRYTFDFNKYLTLAMAAERPNTEYIQNNNTLNDNSDYGKSQVPDFATQLKFKHTNGHIALSGVVRRLQVRVRQSVTGLTSDFTKSRTGWGIGFTGRQNIYKNSGFIWQINGGRGTGRYIDDLNNQAAYLQYGIGIESQFSAIKVMNYIAGAEIWWTPKLSTNMGASLTRISKPKTSLSVAGFNTTQQRYHLNTIYNILPNSQVGLEVMYYHRRAGLQTKRNGEDTRILSSFIYKFDSAAKN
ncbi:DcaP family trimeric outer membrane transporter [Candidatus Odyssella acanthamoebae]|uniref:Porin n=1 Tax=Candidatus Odyssella acanthamoebae TaxID=91604 RepID=A0A077AXC3_9PROT|nr:DcaP family trimeric outer membrane transporter [Candidatus Paracaedibacter acanthamoebae]AIK97246.1 hypothetical protein ID47_11655 [Candidatus Paracaedibacter acanthamoebae]